MSSTSSTAWLRKRLAYVFLMLVLLGSFFVPYGMTQFASAKEAPEMNGVVQASDGNWYLYVDGVVDKTATGIYQNANGWWRVKDGQVDFTANGVYPNELGWWKCTNGKVTFKENGVFQNEYGWWYCKDSKVDFSYTGFGKNSYGFWRIENGRVNFGANGVYQGKSGWYKTSNGRITYDETGVFQNELGWWYCESSKVNFGYTGVAYNSFGKWYCKSGKVDFGFTGFARNKEGNWWVFGGKVDETRNETLTIGTRTFNITNGRVSWDGNYFLQVDAPFSNIKYAGKTLATSGCGPVALVNAIYCLNGNYVPVEVVANWGYNSKYFNSDSFGGISKKEFFTNAADQFGVQGAFRYSGYGKDVTDEVLLNHLYNGGTAVLHVKYHFIAVIDYDPDTNQYFVLDSYPGTGTSMPSKYRTTTAEGDWVTLDELKEGWLAVSEYWMYGKLI